MKQHTLHQEIILKKERLRDISLELKAQFIGLDEIIDEVMSLVSAWYVFPQAQLRPMVINLWGMTGSGKTALVKKLVELLDHKKLYAQMDMGEYESGSASWLKETLTDDLCFFHEKSCILCLDEFQFARSVDADGNELGKDKLRVIWELIDSGKISYMPYNNATYMRRAENCLMLLSKAQALGVVIDKGVVIENANAFLDLFRSFFFENEQRCNTALDGNYFSSQDFINGIYYLTDDDDLHRDSIKEQILQSDSSGIAGLLIEGIKSRKALKELDLSRALIFILGNLDEAYRMSGSINPDLDADELHADTLKINMANIKSALRQRFRAEQIARLGNNHIIYRAFKKEHFRELISRELSRIGNFVTQQLGIGLSFHPSVHDLIYREGVFPAQGTRPVLTTIKNYVESRISRIAVEVMEKQLDVSTVEWSYHEERYVFVFKNEENAVLNIYEEKVSLKVDSLRKTGSKDLQAHTAVHEAGHAVLAALTLRILPSLVVSKSAADGCDGFCVVNMPEGLLTKDVLRKDIVISLGGYVAEKLIFGDENTSSGVCGDIDHATRLANRAVKDYAMGSDPVSIAVASPGNNDFFFMKEHHRRQAMELIRDSEREAWRILGENKFLLLKISEYLTRYHRMEESDIRDFVQKYAVEDWAKAGEFKTKERYFAFDDVVRKQIQELEHADVGSECIRIR